MDFYLLSVFGVAFLLVKGDLTELLRLQISEGDSYIVLMSIVLALSQIIVSKYLKHVDSILLTTVTCAIALGLFIVSCIPELISVPVSTSFDFWASILFMGILGTGLGYVIFYLSIVELGATKTTLFMNLIPFFVVLIAIPFGEQLLFSQLIGGLIIIFGLLIFNWQKQKMI
ncbi:MAG: DMT family transporter [Saprospiraceae bacterium]